MAVRITDTTSVESHKMGEIGKVGRGEDVVQNGVRALEFAVGHRCAVREILLTPCHHCRYVCSHLVVRGPTQAGAVVLSTTTNAQRRTPRKIARAL